MDSEQLLGGLERAAEAASWFEFVYRIDELLEGLGLGRSNGDLPPSFEAADAAASDLNRTLREHLGQLDGRTAGLLLAECYGLCVSPGALDSGMSIFDSVLTTRLRPGRLIEEEGGGLARAYLASLAKLGRILGMPASDPWLARWRLDPRGDNPRLHALAANAANFGAIPLPAPRFVPHPGLPGLQPGDCLFRDLNVTGLSDLGHVGMYLGCDAQDLGDHADWANHQLIEMTTAGCVINNVADFLRAGPFWGFYGADLSASQRSRLVGLAWAHVGLCVYARFSNYKNDAGLQFRCDGFIEYCHETINVIPALPVHRGGGLFENDSWRSLSPSALRNCLPFKR